VISDLTEYCRQVSGSEDEILRRLRAETDSLPNGGWRISPEQGQLLGFLARLTGAREILELGTFTGYGTLHMARALPPGGHIVTCDMSADNTEIARRYWAEAGLAEKIEPRLAPATEILEALIEAGDEGRFDMIFIDANKKDLDFYYEQSLRLARTGGLIIIDNVFWAGQVLDPEDEKKSTRAIRALNLKIRDDARVSLALLPLGDGMTLLAKRD
jgi:caffeoyl-CoA O-methyltransferase